MAGNKFRKFQSQTIFFVALILGGPQTAVAGLSFVGTLNGKTIHAPLKGVNGTPSVKVSNREVTVQDEHQVLKTLPDVPIGVDLESTGNGQAKITKIQPAAATQWKADLDTKVDPKDRAALANITKAFDAASQTMSQVVTQIDRQESPTIDLQQANQVGDGLDGAAEAIFAKYDKTPAAQHGIRNILALNYTRSNRDKKAWYGRDDNFRPEVYSMMYKESRSCVGITKKGKADPIGSGVLIGPNTVLTARHVIEDAISPGDFDVLIDYEQHLDSTQSGGQQLVTTSPIRRHVEAEYYAGTPPDSNSSKLDYTLLTIEEAQPGKERPGIVISMERVTPETPIFLVGHPRRAPRLVHDNSWIKFPYQVSAAEFKHIRIAVNGELAQGGSEDAAEETDQFLRFYESQHGGQYFTYTDRRSGEAMPCMGAECDTFHGDSGAPAMLRSSGELVGILLAGEPDQPDMPNEGRAKSNSYNAGWRRHERLLPITEIVRQLDKEKPNWREECAVNVENNN